MDEVILEVNNVPFQGFTNVRVSNSLENASGSFNFQATTKNGQIVPFKVQDACRVKVNDFVLITGYIDSISPSYDKATHSIAIAGRDKTMDIIDSTITGNINFRAPITLKQVIQSIVSNLGITGVDVINDAGSIAAFSSNDLISADVGENAFSLIEKYCRKRQVLFTTNGDGDIVLARAASRQLNGSLLSVQGGEQNNILSGVATYDYSKRYNKYVVRSQPNPSFGDIPGAFDSVSSTVIDKDIRVGRVLEIQAETSSNADSAKARVEWESNIRRARSLTYTCTVSSLFVTAQKTQIYEPNRLIFVEDDREGIKAIMLIKSVDFSISNDGTNVVLGLVPKDAYTTEPLEPPADAVFNLIGEGST
jgi:prophage tail gpP-like protein